MVDGRPCSATEISAAAGRGRRKTAVVALALILDPSFDDPRPIVDDGRPRCAVSFLPARAGGGWSLVAAVVLHLDPLERRRTTSDDSHPRCSIAISTHPCVLNL